MPRISPPKALQLSPRTLPNSSHFPDPPLPKPIIGEAWGVDYSEQLTIILQAVDEENACEKFFPYQPGKSPREHEEMAFLQEVEVRIQRWRIEDVQERQQFENRIERRHRTSLIVQLLIAVVGGIVALVAAKLLPFFNL